MNEYELAFQTLIEGVDLEDKLGEVDLIEEIIDLTVLRKPNDVGAPGYKGTACPRCNSSVYVPMAGNMVPLRCCFNCGQRIDWSEDLVEEEE